MIMKKEANISVCDWQCLCFFFSFRSREQSEKKRTTLSNHKRMHRVSKTRTKKKKTTPTTRTHKWITTNNEHLFCRLCRLWFWSDAVLSLYFGSSSIYSISENVLEQIGKCKHERSWMLSMAVLFCLSFRFRIIYIISGFE